MSPFLKNSLIILGLVGLAFFGYYLFTTQSESIIRVDNNARVSNQVAAETQEFLRRLDELKSIDFTDDLFNDPRFKSLVNFTEPITPAEVGRENPFEPII